MATTLRLATARPPVACVTARSLGKAVVPSDDLAFVPLESRGDPATPAPDSLGDTYVSVDTIVQYAGSGDLERLCARSAHRIPREANAHNSTLSRSPSWELSSSNPAASARGAGG